MRFLIFLVFATIQAVTQNISLNGTESQFKDDIFESAFETKEFVFDDVLAISPDGQMLAYSVRKKPPEQDLNSRHLPNGIPTSVAGSRIYLSRSDGTENREILTPQGNCWSPIWSPDGQKIAFYSDVDGSPNIWIYELLTNQSRKICSLPIKTHIYSLDDARWSPDSKSIYVPIVPLNDSKQNKFESPLLTAQNTSSEEIKVFSSKENETQIDKPDRKNDETFSMQAFNSTLMAVQIDTGMSDVIVTAESDPPPGFFTLSPSGNWLSYLSVPTLIDHPPYSSQDLVIIRSDGTDPLQVIDKAIVVSDNCYLWHPFLDLIVYVKDKRLYLLKCDSQGPSAPELLYEELDTDFIPQPLLFTRDGKSIVVGGYPIWDSYREKPQSILVLPLDKGIPARSIHLENNWNYIGILKANETQIWQPENETVTLYLEKKTTGETCIVRYDLKDLQPRVLWSGMARMSNFICSNDHRQIFFTYEDLSTPPNIYRANHDFSILERISNIEPDKDLFALSTKEFFESTVPLYNGELKKVRTAVILPKGAKCGDRLPGIVLFYPGANVSRRVRAFNAGSLVTIPNCLFLEKGYALILPDIPLGPEGKPGNPLQEIVDVLLPQIYRAADLGFVDIQRLGIIGQSYGGYGTAAVISQTNLFRSAVAVAGMYDLVGNYGFLDKYNSFFNTLWSENGQGRMGQPPWNNLFRYIENSPYYLADKMHTPLLMIHGEQDETCNVQEAGKLFTALKRLNREVELAIYPGDGHVIDNWKRSHAVDASKRILQFFDDHLKPMNLSED